MSPSSPGTIGDGSESLSDLERGAAAKLQREGIDEISKDSGNVRWKINWLFGRGGRVDSMAATRRYKDREGSRSWFSGQRGKDSRFIGGQAQADVGRLSDTDLADVKSRLDQNAKINDVVVVDAALAKHKKPFSFLPKDFVGKTAEEIAKEIKAKVAGATGVAARNFAFQVAGLDFEAGFAPEDDSQIDAYASQIFTKTRSYNPSFRATFGGEGVSELNVQMAMTYAQKLSPAELEKALNPEGHKTEELKTLEAKASLSRNIVEFGKIESVGGSELNYEDAKKDEVDLKKDLNDLSIGTATTIVSKALNGKVLCYDMSTLRLPDQRIEKERRASLTQQLNTSLTHLQRDVLPKYRSMENKLVAIGKACNTLGKKSLPTSLGTILDLATTPPSLFDNGKHLDASVRPEIFAGEWKTHFELQEGGYDKELSDLQKKTGHKHETLTGPDATIAVYKAILKKESEGAGKRALSDEEAETAAYHLFIRNSLTKSVMDQVKNTVTKKVLELDLKKERDGVFGWMKRHTKEMFFGSEEKFIYNLAKSSGVDPTNYVGLRPSWGNAKYPELITAYFSMRESIRQGHLSNSAYVRSQLEEVSQLLIVEHADKVVLGMHKFDPNAEDDHGPEKKEGEAKKNDGHEKEKKTRPKEIARLIRDFPKAAKEFLTMKMEELPADYQENVKAAIEFATTKTASWRRATGNFIGNRAKNVVGIGSPYNPLTYPGRVVGAGVKTAKFVAWDAPKGVVKKSWGGIKGVGNWLWEVPGGSSGGGGNGH